MVCGWCGRTPKFISFLIRIPCNSPTSSLRGWGQQISYWFGTAPAVDHRRCPWNFSPISAHFSSIMQWHFGAHSPKMTTMLEANFRHCFFVFNSNNNNTSTGWINRLHLHQRCKIHMYKIFLFNQLKFPEVITKRQTCIILALLLEPFLSPGKRPKRVGRFGSWAVARFGIDPSRPANSVIALNGQNMNC